MKSSKSMTLLFILVIFYFSQLDEDKRLHYEVIPEGNLFRKYTYMCFKVLADGMDFLC
jgi:hypothetical protein